MSQFAQDEIEFSTILAVAAGHSLELGHRTIE
jgi:hypothetical protein